MQGVSFELILSDSFESAQKNHLFLNEIQDEWARYFITIMFHEIEHQAEIIKNNHDKIKTMADEIKNLNNAMSCEHESLIGVMTDDCHVVLGKWYCQDCKQIVRKIK